MAKVVCVHGAFHQLWGPWEIWHRWVPAMRDGLWHAGTDIDPDDVGVAFYGDIFRNNVVDGRPSDEELMDIARDSGLIEMVEQAAGSDGLELLAAAVGERQLRQAVNQLGRYFADDVVRGQVQRRVADAVDDDTRVIVAHSMGTVVAYEALIAHPEWPVESLITMGSPLGDEWVFGRLQPSPVDGVGVWPGSVQHWTNIASIGDPAVEEPTLAKCFGTGVTDLGVDNGQRAHDIEPYLNASTTGRVLSVTLS